MPTLRKTFIIFLTTTLSCLMWFGIIYLNSKFHSRNIISYHIYREIEVLHDDYGVFILYLGFCAVIVSVGLGIVLLMRRP